MSNKGPPGERLKFDGNAAKAIDEYREYTRYFIDLDKY
jgi:hypothetical protein